MEMICYPDMPTIIPIPARTKGLPWYHATWNWLTVPTYWMLADDYCYQMVDGARVLFPKGFMFDGASIPRVFWPLINPDGIMFLQGMIHDFAYRFGYLLSISGDKYFDRIGRDFWDEVFYDEGCAINGMTALNYTAWMALQAFGWISWNRWRAKNAQVQHDL